VLEWIRPQYLYSRFDRLDIVRISNYTYGVFSDNTTMSAFARSTDPRRPLAPRNSGDYVPLLSMRRGSRNLNIWSNDNEDADVLIDSQREKRVSASFREEDEDDLARRQSGVFLAGWLELTIRESQV
jgi:hypothetical protein